MSSFVDVPIWTKQKH